MEAKEKFEIKLGILFLLILLTLLAGLTIFDRAHERIINLKIKEIERGTP